MREHIDKFFGRIPAKTVLFLVGGWILLATSNFALEKAGVYKGVPSSFPISVFSGPTIHVYGIPFLFLFVVVLAWAIRFATKLSVSQVWGMGLLLIVLGNLGQGGWDSGFCKPFYESGGQYYHDAIRITSWSEWLTSFNANQPSLLPHARTHPPFAVLSHYLVLHVSANNVTALSSTFVFIASLSIVLVWHIFRVLHVPLEQRNLLALLFSILPAVNIYTAVSLDGLILSSATLALFGMVLHLESGRISTVGIVSIVLGIVITNLLSYGGIFLVIVGGILALREFLLHRRISFALSIVIAIGLFLAVAFALYRIYGYNHLQGFAIALALENPDGLSGWHTPFPYLATRVECVSEIALFLSFGFLAILFHPAGLGISYLNWKNTETAVMLSGVMTLLALFAGGAYRTGETARAALFIYPYIMLTLRNVGSMTVKDILKFAGLQTVGMQLFGGYFW